MKRLILLAGLLSLLMIPKFALASESIDALVDKVVNAYGGKAALEKLVAVRETGQVEAAMGNAGSEAIARTFARPLKLRVQVGDSSKPREVRLLDGKSGWRNGKESTGMGYEAMVLQAVRLDLPYQLLTHRKLATQKDPIEFEGKNLQVLELPLEQGLSVAVAIEANTGRILVSKGTTSSGSGNATTFETRYADFKMVDGLLFASKETNFAGDTKTADITLSKIELLNAVPADVFKP